jgi:hypothetical protein
MFGAPWVTAYQRVWMVENGISRIGNHTGSFHFPFWEGFHLQLIEQWHGLLPTAGASILALLGYFGLFRKDRGAALLIFLFSATTFLLYCKYDYVPVSSFSNRYLMPVVAAAVAPLACLFDALLPSPRSASGHS